MENNTQQSIPTADAYLEQYIDRNELTKEMWDEVKFVMLHYAQLHVKSALKAAAEDAWFVDGCDTHGVEIDENTILDAYPDSNIK